MHLGLQYLEQVIMAPNKDYHAILGIPQSASLEDVKKAYKQLAREWHPD